MPGLEMTRVRAPRLAKVPLRAVHVAVDPRDDSELAVRTIAVVVELEHRLIIALAFSRSALRWGSE